MLASAAGAVVSYFEWVQADLSWWWDEDEVNTRLAERMTRAWQDVVARAGHTRLPLRTAATRMAVECVYQSHELRGLYP